MDIGFLFGWAKEQGVDLPTKADGSINIPAARAFYIDEASRENIGDGNSSAALSERAKERKRYNDGRFAPEGNGNAGKANMNRASANDSEKSVDKLAKREKAIKLGLVRTHRDIFLTMIYEKTLKVI